MPRSRSLIGRLAAGLVLSAALLAIAEVLLRLCAPTAAPSLADYDHYERGLVEMGGFTDTGKLFEEDVELFWKLRPGVRDLPWKPKLWLDNRTNALGFRDVERAPERVPGSLRILCLGDSCTYGTGVRLADSWPQRLEELLATHFDDRVVEVINGGVPGYSSDQGLTFLDRWQSILDPDLVMITFGLNDSRHWDLQHHQERGHGLCRTDREQRRLLDRPIVHLHRSLSSLQIYRRLLRALPRPSPKVPLAPSTEGSVRVPADQYAENLRSMVERCRESACQPVFLVWPIRWQVEHHDGAPYDPPTPFQIAMQEVADACDVPLLDLVRSLEGHNVGYVDSVHMDARGLKDVALEIGRFLDDSKLLPTKLP